MMDDAYRQVIDVLSSCRRILVTTHVRPDGDALGTCAALALALNQKNIEANVLLLSHLPHKYAFIFQDLGTNYYEMQDDPHSSPQRRPPENLLSGYDALLVADTGTWSQLPGMKELIGGWDRPKLVLDHHLTQEDWADVKLVVTEAAAAGEIAAELLTAWDVPLDRNIATALYLAITSDTGWFQFSNTRPYTLRLAASLIEAGVDTDALYQRLYQSERPERLALHTRALDSLELLHDGRLAIMRLSRDDFARAKAFIPDTEAAVNLPLQISTVEVSVLLAHPPAPPEVVPIKISLRSKGRIDVARFAQQFGGGGHARAAGMKLDGPLDAAATIIAQAMRPAMASR